MSIITLAKHLVKVFLKRERIEFVRNSSEYNFEDKKLIEKEKIFFEDLDINKLTSSNANQYEKLVGIDGVCFSGSSAVGDFLGEFCNCTSIGGVAPLENPDRGIENSYEFDFLREPGGILDLERICYNNCTRLRNTAIKQFISVCYEYYKNSIPYFDDYFLERSKKYVKEIMNTSFYSSESSVEYFPKKISLKEYRNISKQYLIDILKNIPSNKYLVCDNLTSIGRPDQGIINDYLGDCKVIYNFSDPRDVYARARIIPGNDWVPVDPEIFVKNWEQNTIPCLNDTNSNTLITNFDDFCNDYETQAKKIMDFLGLEEKDHVDKFKYFNPNVSINNTGVWRKLENQKPIEYIFDNLKEFCYDKENHKRYV